MEINSENWHKKVLEARKRFERGVMGPHRPVKIREVDIERVRVRMINRALRMFVLEK